MSDSQSGFLDRALAAFDRHEDEEALQQLLSAWRESRSERLAQLIERLSVMLPGWLAPLTGPLDLPMLVEDLLLLANHKYPRVLSSELIDPAKWPADPRLTPVLLALAPMPVAQQGPGRVFDHVCDLLDVVRDPRGLGPLHTLRAALPPDSRYANRLDVTLQRLASQQFSRPDTRTSTLSDALEHALCRREEATARSAPLREALLARVAAHPDDDSPRRVLADHLLEQGDPLGELITLQCMPQRDEARVTRLLDVHGNRWTAALGPCVVHQLVRLERAFPVAVTVAMGPGWRLLPPPGPFWSTVREIDWSGTGYAAQADWLAHPHLRQVTVLRQVNARVARRLGAHPLPVRQLELKGQLTHDGPNVFMGLASLPQLSRVEVQEAEPRDVLLCASAPLARRLERFKASSPRAWALTVSPTAGVPAEATLEHESHCAALAETLRASTGFGVHTLHLHSRHRLGARNRALLEAATAGYAHVEWNLPRGFW
ncbi:TIGR02996 domain-containing protein [Myxococcus sp. K38C18041901]|uniref:TIGR02996 domain-containing protein n=1 Tax=Myxococcus guangdongensis TaxID=2906760 RepID=UPI0020A75ABB|nr:TIGR02996 domain-containing protein [Myxococcus guangdongensis]MCP3063648.1 TIGR02996 domain-containing protein [Myxococcus guangdongensis]